MWPFVRNAIAHSQPIHPFQQLKAEPKSEYLLQSILTLRSACVGVGLCSCPSCILSSSSLCFCLIASLQSGFQELSDLSEGVSYPTVSQGWAGEHRDFYMKIFLPGPLLWVKRAPQQFLL